VWTKLPVRSQVYLQVLSPVHSWVFPQRHSQLHSMAHSQATSLYAPNLASKYALKSLSSILPTKLSNTVLIALDDRLRACLTIRSQRVAQDVPKYALSMFPSSPLSRFLCTHPHMLIRDTWWVGRAMQSEVWRRWGVVGSDWDATCGRCRVAGRVWWPKISRLSISEA